MKKNVRNLSKPKKGGRDDGGGIPVKSQRRYKHWCRVEGRRQHTRPGTFATTKGGVRPGTKKTRGGCDHKQPLTSRTVTVNQRARLAEGTEGQ